MGWCRWEGMLGEEVMLHVKKLRLLQKRGDDIPKDKAIEKTRKYLTVVGNAISHLCSRAGAGTLAGSKLSSDELHSKLWQACHLPPFAAWPSLKVLLPTPSVWHLHASCAGISPWGWVMVSTS